MSFLPNGSHPDGDPFAAQDAALQPGFISRLETEARAANPHLVEDSPEPGSEDDEQVAKTLKRRRSGSPPSDASSDTRRGSRSGNDADNDITVINRTEAEEGSEESEDDSDDSESNAGSVALDGENEESKMVDEPPNLDPTSQDGDVAMQPPNAEAGPSTAEVPKKRKRKQPKPEPMPKAPKSQPTIVFPIKLPRIVPKGGVFLNIRDLARDLNQLVEESEPEPDVPSDDSDSDSRKVIKPSLSASTATILGVGGKQKQKKKKQTIKKRLFDRDEGYDKEDPFVDDEELHRDLVKFCGVPARDGFFIWPGVLPLKEIGDDKPSRSSKKGADSDAKPPRKKAKTASEAPSQATSTSSAKGKSAKAKNPVTPSKKPDASASNTPSQKDKVAEPLSAPLQEKVERLKEHIAVTSFVPKNKFPQILKEPLFELALDAVHSGEYDDNFFILMSTIFPYNKFTMTKLVKRELFPRRMAELTEATDNLTLQLQNAIAEQMPGNEAAYETAHEKWESDYVKWRSTQPADAVDPPAQNGNDEVSVVQPGEPPEPKRKFKWDDDLRKILYELLIIDEEMGSLKREKAELEKSTEKVVTSIVARKLIYSRLVTFWPDGWMASNNLSKEMSNFKKKVDK